MFYVCPYTLYIFNDALLWQFVTQPLIQQTIRRFSPLSARVEVPEETPESSPLHVSGSYLVLCWFLPVLIKCHISHSHPMRSTFYHDPQLWRFFGDSSTVRLWWEEETKWNLIELPGQTSGLEQHGDECQMWSTPAQTLITCPPQKNIFDQEEPPNCSVVYSILSTHTAPCVGSWHGGAVL